MNINTALLSATPPTQYENPDDLMRSRIKTTFPLLASIIKDSPREDLMQGIAAGLLAIYEKSLAVGIDVAEFADEELWRTRLLQADDILHKNPQAAIKSIAPLYPHVAASCDGSSNSAFSAGVVLAWMMSHDESAFIGIEADSGISPAAMDVFEELEVDKTAQLLSEIEDDDLFGDDGMFGDAVEIPSEPELGAAIDYNQIEREPEPIERPEGRAEAPIPDHSHAVLECIQAGAEALTAMGSVLDGFPQVGITMNQDSVTISVACPQGVPGDTVTAIMEKFSEGSVYVGAENNHPTIHLSFGMDR